MNFEILEFHIIEQQQEPEDFVLDALTASSKTPLRLVPVLAEHSTIAKALIRFLTLLASEVVTCPELLASRVSSLVPITIEG